MSHDTAVPTVLIVDEDVAFVCWLGELFTQAGYQAVPALHCRQAVTVSRKLELPVDLIAVNPELPGIQRMLQSLAGGRAAIKVILIQDAGKARRPGMDGHATLEKPSGWEPVSRPEWLEKVRRVLGRVKATAAT